MAVIARRENANSEDIEWLDEDEVDLSTIVLPGNYDGETSMPVVTIDEHFTSPWMDDVLWIFLNWTSFTGPKKIYQINITQECVT